MLKTVITALLITVTLLLSSLGMSGCSFIDHNLPIKGIPVQFPGPGDIGQTYRCVTAPGAPKPFPDCPN